LINLDIFHKFDPMRCSVIILLCVLSLQLNSQVVPIFFEKDSYALTEESITVLDWLIVELKAEEDKGPLSITGHTDTDADSLYNENLSYQRAITVQNYLKNNGIFRQVQLYSKGERAPAIQEYSEEQKAFNRRVEITRGKKSDNDLFNLNPMAVQKFNVSPKKDTIITCVKGTKVQIKKGIFETKNSKDPVRIEIEEYYEKSDFVLSNLVTHTLDNKILESRGMINIKAFQGTKEIPLKEGEQIGILFRDREEGDGTTTFNGIETDAGILWEGAAMGGWWSCATYIQLYEGGDTTYIRTIDEDWFEGRFLKVDTKYFGDSIVTDTTDAQDLYELGNLMLASNQLGWINCDRFYESKGPKTDFVVELESADDFDPALVIVFKNINSVLPYSYRKGNSYVFSGIPANAEIEIIGMHKARTSTDVHFARVDGITTSSPPVELAFAEIPYSQLKSKLVGL
jgi:hypothetical protein